MRTTTMMAVIVAALWAGPGSQNAFAQQDGNIARSYLIIVKAGQGEKFEQAFKKHVEWRKQAGDPWNWTVSRVVNGQNLGAYSIRSGGHTWEDLDRYTDFLARGAVEFNKTVGPYIESISSTISRGDPNLANWMADNNEVKMVALTTYYLKPGAAPNFTEVFTKYHKAVKAHNYPVHYFVSWNVNGGTGQRVTIATPLRDWSDMKPPEEGIGAFLARTLGTLEARNMFEQFTNSYRWSESSVLQRLPELSIISN